MPMEPERSRTKVTSVSDMRFSCVYCSRRIYSRYGNISSRLVTLLDRQAQYLEPAEKGQVEDRFAVLDVLHWKREAFEGWMVELHCLPDLERWLTAPEELEIVRHVEVIEAEIGRAHV